MTDDLIAFVRARLDDEEKAARLMNEYYPSPWDTADRGWMARVVADEPDYREVTRLEQWNGMADGPDVPWLGDIINHIARHEPARILAQVEAARAMLDDLLNEPHTSVDDPFYSCAVIAKGDEARFSGPCDCGRDARVYRRLCLLALPNSDHPEFREEWRP